MSLKKNILGNGLASAIQKFVKLLEQLLLVPFFISSWGAAYYGEWLTLTIIPSVIAFSDLGFGSAAANNLVLRYAAGRVKEAADIAKSGFLIISSTVLLGAILSCIAMVVMAHYHVFDKSLIVADDAIWAVSILILARLICFYTQFYEAYFRSARKAALSINYVTVNSFLNLGAGIIVLQLGYGVIIFAASQLVVAILFNVVYAINAKNIIKFDAIGEVKMEDIKEILHKGLGYLLSPIWQSIYFQGTTFVVRIVLGAEAVAVFNTVRTVSRSINQLFTMINNTVFPELQFEIGAGNFVKAHKLFRISVWLAFICAIAGVLFLLFFGQTFYSIWTNNKLEAPTLMWNILIVGILFNAMWWTAGVVFRAVNKPYQFSIMGVIAAVISVITSYFLSEEIGITGAALGTLLLDVLLAFYVLPVSSRLLGISLQEVIKNGPRDIVDVFVLVKNKLPFLSK
jgi:O-antigen/teichoic acid export membrane protein